jgi:hypothetical protein
MHWVLSVGYLFSYMLYWYMHTKICHKTARRVAKTGQSKVVYVYSLCRLWIAHTIMQLTSTYYQ